jgi:inner membrane protein
MLVYYSQSRWRSAISHQPLDNLTHSLFAVTLGRTPLGRAGRGTMAALLIASNIPDLDAVTLAGGGVSYLKWHRGPTHGPLGVIGLGLVSAGLAWGWQRFRDRRKGVRPLFPEEPRASFAMLAAISIVGVLLHVLMDVPTSYGTRVLSPFDWHWFAVDWLPIIDIYLLAILVVGLLFGAASAGARRRNAAIVLVLMAANYGIRGVAHHQALVAAPRLFGSLLPAACDPSAGPAAVLDRWPQPEPTMAAESDRRCLVEIAAMPTFLSPFKWRIIARLSNAYEIHEIDLLDGRGSEATPPLEHLRRVTLRFPNNWTPRVTQAADTRLGRVFLGFSRFPSVRAFTDPTGATTVRWSDMRFAGGILALDQPVRRPDPFTAVVHIGADGRIDRQQLGH